MEGPLGVKDLESCWKQGSSFLVPLYGRVGLICFFLHIYFVLFPLPMVGKVSQLKHFQSIS